MLPARNPAVTNLELVGFSYPDPVAVCIDILAVPEPKTVKNRAHIDLATTSAAIRRTWSHASWISLRRPPTWARATSRGGSWPTRKTTSSASSPRADAEPLPTLTVNTSGGYWLDQPGHLCRPASVPGPPVSSPV